MNEINNSIHDNNVYGYSSDCAAGILILHTAYDYPERALEFTDLIFEGVEVHRLVEVGRGNILYGVDEIAFDSLPKNEKGDEKELIERTNCKIYQIDASCGMYGWVAAQSVRVKEREQRIGGICQH